VRVSVPAAPHYFQTFRARTGVGPGAETSVAIHGTPLQPPRWFGKAKHRLRIAAKGQTIMRSYEARRLGPAHGTSHLHQERTPHGRLAALASIVAMASAMALLSSMAAEADAPRGSAPLAPASLINF